jgi:uncharacterized LabA/DUF88 family protein
MSIAEQKKQPQRVVCYVDGFNLYFGLRDAGYQRFLWLNVDALAERLIRDDQELVATKYFTARISGGVPSDSPSRRAERNDSRKRQATYLDALATVLALTIFEGQFLANRVTCNRCGATWSTFEEKMTDVNIATEMLVDAFANRFDVALLISADSDLVPPVTAVLRLFPHKRVNVAFPPERHSKELKDSASGQFVITRGALKKSQFPDEVTTENGFIVRRPEKWK